jgi:hypothetical protein
MRWSISPAIRLLLTYPARRLSFDNHFLSKHSGGPAVFDKLLAEKNAANRKKENYSHF